MSGNLDHIDLNSDVVLAEPDNDTVSEPNMVGVSDAETLGDSKKGESRIEESVVDGVRDLEKEKLDSGERKNEGFDRGIDLEMGIAAVDKENDCNDGNFGDVSGRGEAEEVTETKRCQVEANSRFQVEEKMEGNGHTGVVGASSLVSGDAVGIDDVGTLDSLHGGVNMEVKAANDNELLSKNGSVAVPVDTGSDHPEHEVMDIDVETKICEGQTLGSDGHDAGVSKGIDSNEADDLNSDVDSDTDMDSDEDVKVAKKVKADAAKPEFNVSDLVWGKVTSHPWWPGQIFDSSDATKKAKKYFKKDRFLIGYFGDQTFAWNDASKIKPFRQHFSQIVEQSNLEDFHNAVDCALDEVSRRVEYGLACSCMPDYNIIKTQIIVNTGIREECCRRDGGDRFSTADSFEPLKLIEYVKALAELPSDGVDRLEFVTAQAQLLAFNRWKGYSDLPEFQNLGTSLENDVAEIQPSSKVKHGSSAVEENTRVKIKNDGQKSFGEGNSKSPENLPRKRKQDHEDMEGLPKKKEKSLADLLAEKRSSSQYGKSRLDSKGTTKLIPSPSSKKRKAVSPISDDEVAKHSNSSPISNDKVVKHSKSPSSEAQGNSSQPKKTYRVGDSILRVASQLSGSSGILKSVNGSSQKTATKGKSSSGQPRSKKLFSVEDSVPHEMILQLRLVAKGALKSCDLLESIVGFFSKFRNSICPNSVDLHDSEQSSSDHSSVEKETRKSEIETSRSEQTEDTSGNEHSSSIPEEQSSPDNQKEAENCAPQTPTKEGTATMGSEPAVPFDPSQNPDQQTAEAANSSDDDACTPTALILNFTNLDSVPSVTNLNKIFSQYGLLKESETEVLKKSRRAKVVFHKSADAEAAFSSAGKYSIFGPSLVSYRLKYMPSKSSKSLNAKKRSKTGAPSAEGNAA